MSVLFPKVPKPREWDYRPIYYDKDKEARKQRLARFQHGDFRKAHEVYTRKSETQKKRSSKMVFWIALLALLLFVFYFLL